MIILYIALWAALHIALHEFGHALAVLLTKGTIHGIGFNWRGFYLIHNSSTAFTNFVVAMAGPLANIFTYVILSYLGVTYAWIPLWVAIFNLLPLPHSDGLYAAHYLHEMKRTQQT